MFQIMDRLFILMELLNKEDQLRKQEESHHPHKAEDLHLKISLAERFHKTK
jgi:hypothetical protein